MSTAMDVLELKPGVRFNRGALQRGLPTMSAALFFAKLYGLNAVQLARLLFVLFHRDSVVSALVADEERHSIELQDYLLELGYEDLIEEGVVVLSPDVPRAEILPEIWKDLEVQVAASIRDVADKLKDVLGTMPGRNGEMVFDTMMKVNARRPVLGDYRARIDHARKPDNLIVLDVSGSMTEETVRTLVDDVVAMGYMADAHLAIVSDTATHWEPGTYSTVSVLAASEYSGTHYETLAALFDRDWGVVVTIADYDSSYEAMGAIAKRTGRIGKLLDISLVRRPTFLSEVLGQLADESRSLLVAAHDLTG